MQTYLAAIVIFCNEVKGYKLGGVGKTVEVDGAYFGGYVKPANNKENRRDRRLAKNQNGKRQCVVVIRERGGMVLPSAFKPSRGVNATHLLMVPSGAALAEW